MAFKFSSLSFRASGGKHVDPDTAIIDDLADDRSDVTSKPRVSIFSLWPRRGQAVQPGEAGTLADHRDEDSGGKRFDEPDSLFDTRIDDETRIDAGPRRDADAYGDAGTYGDAGHYSGDGTRSDADGHSYADGRGDTECHSYADAHGAADDHSYADAHGAADDHSYADAHGAADARNDTDAPNDADAGNDARNEANGHSYAQAHDYAGTYGDAGPHGDGDGYPRMQGEAPADPTTRGTGLPPASRDAFSRDAFSRDASYDAGPDAMQAAALDSLYEGTEVEAPNEAGSRDGHGGVPAAPPTRAPKRMGSTPLLGRLRLKQQVTLLLGVITVGLTVALGSAAYDSRTTNMFAAQNEVVGDALMHSQRLAKAAGIAVQGSTLAYDQLQDSVKQLTAATKALTLGATIGGQRIAPLGDALQPVAHDFARFWEDMAPNVGDVISQEKVLVRFNRLNYQGRIAAADLLDAHARAMDAVRRSGGNPQDILLLTQMDLHLRTIVGEMSRLMQTNDVRAEDAATLAKSIEGLALVRSAALDGNAALGLGPLRSAEARAVLQQIAPRGDAFVKSALEAQQALPALDQARVAGRKVFFASERLTDSISALRSSMVEARASGVTSQWLVIGFGGLALLGLMLLGKAYYDDSSSRAQEAEAQRAQAERLEQEAKRLNDQNQAAILRLMNELQEVADGNLTVQATVSEDITGAIADSVNYTVEELRDLVGRINNTAAAVAEASGQAQITSSSLQAASDQQSREIRETGEAVLSMATQIKQVSESASETAEVARRSLTAAGRGRDAVQNSIAGMNGIRDQIQDTAKRIKRLGESSQEIGEIIELISDITEQTNVLALNAAIQAASAGEAGRGFTIVAEEVQRLAEKSAEATRQISALVKAIQTDTHDAVAAMERSTQGVVQGTKLSDEAGAALSGIGQISHELADLIKRISRTTENQAESAELVAQSIQRILLVTEQTSEGTQQTAGSILQLSELARELKNSVSRFRVA